MLKFGLRLREDKTIRMSELAEVIRKRSKYKVSRIVGFPAKSLEILNKCLKENVFLEVFNEVAIT